MTTPDLWRQEELTVSGCRLSALVGGHGTPIVVLPRDNAHPRGQRFIDLLAKNHTVYAPYYPGYSGSDAACWSWLADVRDLASTQHQWMHQLGLTDATVVGLGFGGWIAAELAVTCTHQFRKLVLVDPMGIQPVGGEIYDQFLVNAETYARTGFHDQAKFDALYGEQPAYEQLDAWESDREMTSRVAWKPYMYNRSLPRLLAAITTPAIVVWGEQDRIVPVECAQLYTAAIRQSRLVVIPECGHAVDVEKPDELAQLVQGFAVE